MLLAMDTWGGLIVGPEQVMLGLVIHRKGMMVGIPANYIQGVHSLIDST
jgi:hypothetical protein